MRFTTLFLMLSATPTLAAGEQFDLDCRGGRMLERGGEAAPHAVRLRVDLESRKWCMDDCQRVLDIHAIKDDAIMLQDDMVLNTRMEITDQAWIERATNAFHQKKIMERPEPSYMKFDATCERGAFTPFPVR